MGGTKIESGGTSTATATAEETALNKLNLEKAKATQQGQITAQNNSLNLINQLLTGQIPQGELFNQLTGGISADALAGQATSMMRSGRTGAQASGISESGVADRAISKDLANNLLMPAQQFNIGAAQNLMNLALSGQAQVQQPIQANVNQLGSQLAGLRTTQTTGYQSNPFTGVNLGIFGKWGSA
jgi:hypothetical protein